MINWNALAAPFDPEKVDFRVGNTYEKDGKTFGTALAYIDARDVAQRLDDVVGPAFWQDFYEEFPSGRIMCTLTIFFDSPAHDDAEVVGTRKAISKQDGAGSTQVEGEKGGISDAFKRAAVKFGIFRYGYELETQFVQLEKRGKGWAIPKAKMADLRKTLPKPAPAGAEGRPKSRGKNTAPKTKEAPASSQEPSGERERPKSNQADDGRPLQTEVVGGGDPGWTPFTGPYFRGKGDGEAGFLDLAGMEKERVGSRLYYACLGRLGLKKANQLAKGAHKKQGQVLYYLSQLPALDTKEGFAQTLELQLEEAQSRKDAVLLKSIVDKANELGENPTEKQLLAIGDEIETILGADQQLNEKEE